MQVDRDFLVKLYWEEGRSLREIGRILGISHLTVKRWFEEFNIPLRSKSEQMKLVLQRESPQKKRARVEKAKKTRQKRLESDPEYRKKLREAAKKASEGTRKRWREYWKELEKKYPREQMYKLYVEEKKSLREIAQILGWKSSHRVANYLEYLGIKRRNASEAAKAAVEKGKNIGMTKQKIRLHNENVLLVAEKLKSEGYRVLVTTERYIPDVIAIKGDVEVVIAVEVSRQSGRSKRKRKIQKAKVNQYDVIIFYEYKRGEPEKVEEINLRDAPRERQW